MFFFLFVSQMLNCILGMVDKTKKALSILESRQTGKKRILRESGSSNPQMVNGSAPSSFSSSSSGSLTIGNLIGAAAHAAVTGSPLVAGANGGSVVGFNGSTSNNGQHLNWSGSHEVQTKSSRPLLNTCSSSSSLQLLQGTGAGATALVPSSSSSSLSSSSSASPSTVRTVQGSMTSNKVGSFAPLSSSSVPYGSSATVVSPRIQQQLSPPGQQSMIQHSRSSAARSPLVSASSSSFNMYYNNAHLTCSNGQGAVAPGHHPSASSFG